MSSSSPLTKTKNKLLRRLVSCITPEALLQQHPTFTRLLKSITDQDLEKFKSIFQEENFPVDYHEAIRGKRCALHYAAKGNFLAAVQYLLYNNASCDIRDEAGVTPLHLAANEGWPMIVQELICHGSNVDLQDNRGRTALHWAVTSSDDDDESSSNIIKVVKLLLLKSSNIYTKDNEGRLALHLAARSGVTSAVKILLSNKGSGSISSKDESSLTPLHLAVLGAQSLDTVSLLISRGAYLDSVDKNGQTPMHLLVGRKPANVDEEFDVACLEILLNNGASVSIVDRNESTPLTLILSRTVWWSGGASTRDFYLTIVQMLVAKGAKITSAFALWRMIEAFPGLLKYIFNHSIGTNTSVLNSVHLILEYDMRCFIDVTTLKHAMIELQKPNNCHEEELPNVLSSLTDVSMLHFLIHSGNKQVLRHPICRVLLHLKWVRIRKYFAANFALNCFFVLALTFFVLSITDCSLRNANSEGAEQMVGQIMNKSEASLSDFQAGNETLQECLHVLRKSADYKLASWILMLALYVIIVIREILQISHCSWHRLVSFKQALIIILIITIPLFLILPCPCLDWWLEIGALVVVCGWIHLLLSLGQFPTFGVYVVMFSTVATNVLKFLGLYMLLILGFAFGFHVLLRPYDTFRNLFLSVSTTFVMMTGELDYESVFVSGKQRPELLGVLVLLFFIFCVYIILSNLLVGLAVSDLTSIRKRSEVMRLCTQVELMVQFEEVIRSPLWPRCLQESLMKSISLRALSNSPIISLLPNKKRGFVTSSYKFFSNFIPKRTLNKIFESFVDGFIPPEYEPQLPRSLLRASLKIALNQFEMQKRDKLLRQQSQLQRSATVISKMPMPNPSRKSMISTFSIYDAVNEESDDSSDSDNFDVQCESQSFIRKKQLTLRKSSRRNLLKSHSSDAANDIDDIRLMLSDIHASLNSYDKIGYQRRQSQRSGHKKITFSDEQGQFIPYPE